MCVNKPKQEQVQEYARDLLMITSIQNGSFSLHNSNNRASFELDTSVDPGLSKAELRALRASEVSEPRHPTATRKISPPTASQKLSLEQCNKTRNWSDTTGPCARYPCFSVVFNDKFLRDETSGGQGHECHGDQHNCSTKGCFPRALSTC